MLEVPWVAGEGIPDSPADGTEYAELLAAGMLLAVCNQLSICLHTDFAG